MRRWVDSRRRAPWLASLLAIWLAAQLGYRAAWIEPREWGAICAAAAPPLACLPREGLLWMQHYGVWGLTALALGLAAFLGAPVAWAAMAMGLAGVVNYNASFGMLGLALGAWAWISPARGAAGQGRPAPAPPPSRPGTAG